jgi:hypothetical protein
MELDVGPNSHLHILFFEDLAICTYISELVVSLERFHRKCTVRSTIRATYPPSHPRSLKYSLITVWLIKVMKLCIMQFLFPSVILLLLQQTSTCSSRHLLPTRINIIFTYRLAQKSVNWLVKSTIKYFRNFFITN